jgi:uncharacterized protein
MKRLQIAVAGSGIAGLSCAWLLSQSHDVTLFERDARFGGHANTVDATEANGAVPIDTGFIVYNTACYPNLIALFDHLGVATAATKMGFAVSMRGGDYEYCGTGLHGLFGQPSNLLNPAHLAMTRDILRFFRDAQDLIAASADETLSLGDWLDQRGYSRAFRDLHILPMAAAIWSAPADEAFKYPIAAFARFFANHGLLQVRNRPQWRTVVGGSRSYVQQLRGAFNGRVVAGNGVAAIVRNATGVDVRLDDGRHERFDHIVLAGHADDARRTLSDASADETRLLAPFRYQSNHAVLHTDPALMPRRKRLWSSWNYVGGASPRDITVTYWMNALQPLATNTDYFVTLNPSAPIARERIVAAFDYAHPIFDAAAIAAQRELWTLQGQRRTWFAGSYFGSGFHEDALQSGLWVAEMLGGKKRPWSVANESDRLNVGSAAANGTLAEAAE